MRNRHYAAVLATALLFACGGALADKPDRSNGGKHEKKEHADHGRDRQDDRRDASASMRFDDAARHAIFDYYGAQARAGKCPPGLAKKHNGCQPPGQAKKWQIGQPLPSDLRYGSLPPELLRRLPPPPPRHRYVQVAGDILMIAVGSSMVVDAVEDILR